MTIINWYRNQRNDFGIAAATWLLWRVIWRRCYVVARNKLLPRRFMCPCCGWEGNCFFDYIEMGYTVPNYACPSCDSHSRHRALYLWLRDDYQIAEKTGVALVFASERAFNPLWQSAKYLQVYKIDLDLLRDVDVQADLMKLPLVAEAGDLVWCHHVLEQIPDHRIGLRELHRVC